MPSHPIARDTISSRVYREIKEALISGAFMPAERLTLHKIAKELAVSVTPVREALMRLASEHALQIEAAKMISVPRLDAARYLELRTIRLALEPLATGLAAAALDKTEIARLAEYDRQFRENAGSSDPITRMVYNKRFHFHVYRHCGQPALLAVIEGLWASLGPILRAYYCMTGPRKTAEPDSHADILAALGRKDAKAAADAMHQDILGASDDIMTFLRGLGDGGAPCDGVQLSPSPPLVGGAATRRANRRPADDTRA